MADITISSDKFSSTMKLTLQEVAKVTGEALKNAVNTTTNETLRKTKANAPVLTGAYKRAWKSKGAQANTMQYNRTVYNSPEYSLTHLLQNGHRGPHPARAYPHIPQDDETEELFIKNLKAEIEK